MQYVIYYDLRCLSVDFFFLQQYLTSLNPGTENPWTISHLAVCVLVSPSPKSVPGPTEYTLLLPSSNGLRWRVVEDVGPYSISSRAVITDKTPIQRRGNSISLWMLKCVNLLKLLFKAWFPHGKML